MNFLTGNIKYLRGSLGMNQAVFGQLFNCTRDNIASYERGTEPKLETLQSIVNYFHITLDDIYTKDLSQESALKDAQVNAQVNAPLTGQKSPPGKQGSFKQSLNDGPQSGENQQCEKCKEKERTIEAQRTTIYTQQELIKSLKDRIEELTHQGSGQKRKAG